MACTAGKYKADSGSAACSDCDANANSPEASTALTDCVCNAGFAGAAGGTCSECAAGSYENTATDACESCPSDASAPAGSAAPTDCACNAGYTGDGGTCTACAEGTYKAESGSAVCSSCGANQDSPAASTTADACFCAAGFAGAPCESCGTGKYCLHGVLEACPANSVSPSGSDAITDCLCDAGYTGPDGGACEACAAGTYKTSTGSAACDACDSNADSPAGSTDVTACVCNAGYSGSNGESCSLCQAGKYDHTETHVCKTCPPNSDSPAGSVVAFDCICNAGYSGPAGGPCQLCDAGTYCTGDPIQSKSTCPNFSTSLPGSKQLTDCQCNGGYYGVDGGPCIGCISGKYKDVIGSSDCNDCDVNAFSESSSVYVTNCKCNMGYTGSGLTCSACESGTFKAETGDADCEACPAHSHSPAASDELTDCLCEEGYLGTAGGPCGYECPVGYEMDSTNTGCVACNHGFYKQEQSALLCQACPPHSSSLVTNSSNVDDCFCLHGYVRHQDWHAGQKECISCGDSGQFNNENGEEKCYDCYQNSGGNCELSTDSLSSLPFSCPQICSAPPGYETTATGENLKLCSENKYNDGSYLKCKTCPSGSSHSIVGSQTIDDCVCHSGYYRVAPQPLCGSALPGYFSFPGYYEPFLDHYLSPSVANSKQDIPFKTVSGSPDMVEACDARDDCFAWTIKLNPSGTQIGSVGYMHLKSVTDDMISGQGGWSQYLKTGAFRFNTFTKCKLGCDQCPPNTYKNFSGPDVCLSCHANSNSVSGADNINDCVCNSGYTGSSQCTACESGKYKDIVGTSECTSCPSNSFSHAGSQSVDNCLCNAGFSYNYDSRVCEACTSGKFKTEVGNDNDCLSCQVNANSLQASTSPKDCTCNLGYEHKWDDFYECVPECQKGHFGNRGLCALCPTGKFQATNAQSSCSSCPAPTVRSLPGTFDTLGCFCPAGQVGMVGMSIFKVVKAIDFVTPVEEALSKAAYYYKAITLNAHLEDAPSILLVKVHRFDSSILILSCSKLLCPDSIPLDRIYGTVTITSGSGIDWGGAKSTVYTQQLITFTDDTTELVPSHKQIQIQDTVFLSSNVPRSSDHCLSCPPGLVCQ